MPTIIILKNTLNLDDPQKEIYFLVKESFVDAEKLQLLKQRLINEILYTENWTRENLVHIAEDSFHEFGITLIPFSLVNINY